VVAVPGGRGKGKVTTAALACYRPGRRSRLIYRQHVWWRRRAEPKSFTWRGYRDLLIAAHHQLPGGKIVLIWDNLSVHLDIRMSNFIAGADWLSVVQLPAYAPELNPVEGDLVGDQDRGAGQPRRHRPGPRHHRYPARPQAPAVPPRGHRRLPGRDRTDHSRHEPLRLVNQAAETTAMVMFIIANAAVLAWVMITFRIPQSIVAPIESLTTSPVAVTLLVCLVLVALAIFLEPPAILIAVVPIVLPVVAAVGVDPLRFGVIVMLTTTIGMLLPPVGISLLVAVGILDTPLERAAKAAVPYVALAAVTLVLVVLFPDTTRLLVKLVH
jgi:hypothetical protein